MSRHLSAALGYLGLGWRVFPLTPRGKRPLGRLVRRGCLDATRDPELVGRWWGEEPDAGIGVATGRASWLYVVDIDGDEGRGSWDDLVGDEIVETLTQETGGGGAQIFFQRPFLSGPIGNRTKALPGIDVRCDGGYVVVPPSVHPSGRRYRWSRRAPILDLPRWILGALTRKGGARKAVDVIGGCWPGWSGKSGEAEAMNTRRSRRSGRAGRYADAALSREAEAVAASGRGCRNSRLNRAAYSLGRLVGGGYLSRDAVASRLCRAAVGSGLGERESMRTVESGLRAGEQRPRWIDHD